MKKTCIAIVTAITLLCGCTQKTVNVTIKPMASGFSIDNLTDAIVPVSFTPEDFDWMGGNLKITVYTEDLYDAVEISLMKAGDTIVFDNNRIVIAKMENKDGFLTVNNGLEEGGATLQAYEGGTYRGVVWDNHSTYTRRGEVTLPLAEGFTLINCGDDPHAPSDTIATEQKLYIESLQEHKRDFNCLNTRVLINNGLITNIIREWIP